MAASFERILLATEHTEFDEGAERVALELARKCGAPLAAVVPLTTNTEFEAVAPELAARAEEHVHAKVDALHRLAHDAGVALDVVVRRGDEPTREIVAEAERRRSDLVVVRRRGKRSFLARLTVGEIAGHVATHAPCSVLLVPRAAHLGSQRVLAAVDASPAGPKVAAAAADFAQRCALPLVVASVAPHATAIDRTTAERALAAAVAIAECEAARAEGRVLAGHPDEAIAACAAGLPADLIVVGRGGEGHALQRLLLGGTAQRIIGRASCPVLVVRT